VLLDDVPESDRTCCLLKDVDGTVFLLKEPERSSSRSCSPMLATAGCTVDEGCDRVADRETRLWQSGMGRSSQLVPGCQAWQEGFSHSLRARGMWLLVTVH
jgi:hypothetical protein